mgnify:CR=1 FL=1
MTIFDILPADGHGVTCDLIYRPRKQMTRAQALEILAVAAKHKPGTIPEEFIEEAMKVVSAA